MSAPVDDGDIQRARRRPDALERVLRHAGTVSIADGGRELAVDYLYG